MSTDEAIATGMQTAQGAEVHVPVIITSFRDFELEERAVRLLSQMGFAIGDRKIVGVRNVHSNEIVVTDQSSVSALAEEEGIPSIVLTPQVHQWSDASLHHFLYRSFIPEGEDGAEVVITSSPEHRWRDERLRSELIGACARAQVKAIQATFDERDIRLALIPTRRKEEIDRLDRFAKASLALLILGAHPKELRIAESLIEYRRRIHTHLDLAFVVVGGRKRIRAQIASALEPYPLFWIEDESEELVRLRWPMSKGGSDRFERIVEWIGSRHGDSRQSRAHLDTTRRRRDRAPDRARGPMATAR